MDNSESVVLWSQANLVKIELACLNLGPATLHADNLVDLVRLGDTQGPLAWERALRSVLFDLVREAT